MPEAARAFGVPEVAAEPDFTNLLKVLRRERPERPTLFEFFLNPRLYRKLTGRAITEDMPLLEQTRVWVKAFRNAGYDYARTPGSSFCFPRGEVFGFRMGGGSVISDRASFETFPWQNPDSCDYSLLTEIESELPPGMKLIVSGPGGVLENAIALVGIENLCYLIADDPELVADVFQAIGSRLVRHYEIAAPFPAVGACISNDDWGFKTQTMLSPADMRRLVFPWHRRIVQAIHAAGKPAILHSCGNLEAVMDDIIDDLKFDGKHSYEDTIQPVEEAYEEYGQRLAILGGIDLDFVCRKPPAEVYRRSQAMLERTAASGGYALGTGNSVPEYVPDENYFAMIAAALDARE